MKYCFKYFKSQFINNIDEIIISYNNNSQPTDILNFVNKHSNQRIIANIDKEIEKKDLDAFAAASSVYPNFTVRLNAENKELINQLKELKIKFFFTNYASTWDLLYYYISEGVSDVYVVSELLFSIGSVRQKISEEVKIRAFPNIAQSSALPQDNNIDTFKCSWISPRDIYVYEGLVDVLEFWGPLDKQDVLYKIYRDKKWSGDLGQLILGFKDSIMANALPPGLAETRIDCGKRCNYTRCKVCDNARSLAGVMKEKNYNFRLITKSQKENI